MITLHTIENAYDDGNNYHQFVQRGRQALLDSKALGSEHTLRSFVMSDVIDDCLLHLDLDERCGARFHKLLVALLEAGEFGRLFSYAERIYMRDFKEGDVTMTRFGSWEHDSMVIDPPSLRELQNDLWASDERFPREDWKHEVENDETHLGYWEWVENQMEQNSLPTIVPGMRVRWNDPDDGACSHEGIVTKCTTPIEDEIVVIHMTDGWCNECLRPELEILSLPVDEDQPPQ